MYKVIKAFADAQDGGRIYKAGELFPRQGYAPDTKRVLELASSSNRLGYPVIAESVDALAPVEAEEAPKRRGRRKATEE